MIKNILGIIIVLLIGFYIYYKLKYPFWSIQPVFHFHNIKYWLFPPGIIQHKNPKINKFFDQSIEFYNIENLSTDKKALFINLIKAHFMPNKYENYRPNKDNILDYFISHNKPSFISLYFKQSMANQTLQNNLISGFFLLVFGFIGEISEFYLIDFKPCSFIYLFFTIFYNFINFGF